MMLAIVRFTVLTTLAVVLFAGCPVTDSTDDTSDQLDGIVNSDGSTLMVSDTTHVFGAGEDTWTFEVWNAGKDATTLQYKLEIDQTWLKCDAETGTSQMVAGVPERKTVKVTLDRAGFRPMEYKGNIFVSSSGGKITLAVTVSLSAVQRWSKLYPFSAKVWCYSACLVKTGSYAVAGGYQDFAPGAIALPLLCMVKHDGTMSWSKAVDYAPLFASSAEAMAVTELSNGSFLLAGTLYADAITQKTNDVFVLRTKSDGTSEYIKSFDFEGTDGLLGLAYSSETSTASFLATTSDGLAVVKFDTATGAEKWRYTQAGVTGVGITMQQDGGCTYYGLVTLDGVRRAFRRQIATGGVLQAVEYYPDSKLSNLELSSVASAPYSSSAATLRALVGRTQVSTTDEDALVLVDNSTDAAQAQWLQVNAKAWDSATTADVTTDGSILIAGESGSNSWSAGGPGGIFAAKMTPAGKEYWRRTYMTANTVSFASTALQAWDGGCLFAGNAIFSDHVELILIKTDSSGKITAE